jgi:hypothetical protein
LSRRAVITGDLLRAESDLSFNQRANVQFLAGVLQPSLEAIGYRVSILGACEGDFPFQRLYELAYGCPGNDTATKWATFFDRRLPDPVRSLLEASFDGSVSFLFEGSPTILKLIEEMGGVYLNFRIHPLRFGADLIMAMESNDQNVMARIRKYEMSSDIVNADVENMKAQWAGKPLGLPRGAVVFLAQTRHDASVIVDGKFMDLANRADELIGLVSSRPAFHKPHPFDPDAPTVGQWLSVFPDSREIKSSAYNIMASEAELEFITISSGAGYEAELFGHKTHFLNPKNWGTHSAAFAHFSRIRHEYWSADFWRHVLDGQLDGQGPQPSSFVPDRLRASLQVEWAPRW